MRCDSLSYGFLGSRGVTFEDASHWLVVDEHNFGGP